MIDQRSADFQGVGHADPVRVAQKLVAHVANRLQAGHLCKVIEVVEAIGMSGVMLHERVQAFAKRLSTEHVSQLPGHEHAFGQVIGPGRRAAIARDAGIVGRPVE